MKKRYLIRFSYLGNHFLSCAKNTPDLDLTSVSGALQLPLKDVTKNLLASDVALSSRTDRGVHAIQNTAHFDLEVCDKFHAPSLITKLNKFYIKENIALRVSDIQQVSADFNARKFAIQRSYLYRIAVPKIKFNNLDHNTPISEITRCYFLREPGFDIDAVEKGSSFLVGTHNFINFTGKSTKQVLVRTPIRRITSFSISPGAPLMNALHDPSSNNFDYWDFVVEGRSFNYRQVRRMVGALTAIGQGKFSVNGLQRMLDSKLPSTEWILSKIAPAHGLYLMNVIYNDEDLAIDRKWKQPSVEHLRLLFLINQREIFLKV